MLLPSLLHLLVYLIVACFGFGFSVGSSNNEAKNMAVFEPLTSDDQETVWIMLQHAAHESNLETVKSSPVLRPYAQKFGSRIGDIGVKLVDVTSRDVVGAAWVRVMENGKGFATLKPHDELAKCGNGNPPELAIAVLPEYRGCGMGSKLLRELLQAVQEQEPTNNTNYNIKRYQGVCLSCREGNPAMKLYERIGFVKLFGTEVVNRTGGTSITMLYKFDDDTTTNVPQASSNTFKILPATQDHVDVVLDFINKKADFDRSVGAFQGTLEVTKQRLIDTLFSSDDNKYPPFAHVLLVEESNNKQEIKEHYYIGFVLYSFHYSSFKGQPSLWLDDLYVMETMRSNGVGYKIMQELSRIAKERNCSHIGWTADARNVRGIKFYKERLGATIMQQNENRCVLQWKPQEQTKQGVEIYNNNSDIFIG